METTTNTTANRGIVTFAELLPYQNWEYVEVVKDYHKHLGNSDTELKLATLNEVIEPYRKANGNTCAALQFLTLAVYMGGILTDDCMRVLEMVKAHREKKADKSNSTIPNGWKYVDTYDDKVKSTKVHTRAMTPDEVAEVLFGSVEAMDKTMNNFFGFDVKKASTMSDKEFLEYMTRTKKLGRLES